MFVDECHVTRLNQGLFSTTMEAEKRDPGNEVETKDAKQTTALCNAISPTSAWSPENIHGKMALDREPTLTQWNIQRTPFHLLQKGEIFKRYTCESKTLRVKVQHHHEKWELCLVCQHSFNLSVIPEIFKVLIWRTICLFVFFLFVFVFLFFFLLANCY